MINQIEIVKDIFVSFIRDEKNDLTEIINWKAITTGFVLYETDPKPLYAEIYKLELPDPEEIISKFTEWSVAFVSSWI